LPLFPISQHQFTQLSQIAGICGERGIMRFHNVRGIFLCLVAVFAGSTLAAAQQPSAAPASDGSEIAELRGQLQATRQQLSETEDKLRELSSVVAGLQRQMSAQKPEIASAAGASTSAQTPGYAASTQEASAAAPATQAPAKITEEEWHLLNEKVEEHEQVKVGSASKFRLKLSGMMLLNVFGNDG
jgi:TolA-binding protein